MKTFNVLDIVGEPHLSNAEDAGFLATRLQKGALDFTGIVSVEPSFAAALLKGWKPEDLEGRLLEMAESVERVFVAWLEGQTPLHPGPHVSPKVVIPPIEVVPSTASTAPTPVVSEGERHTPTRLMNRLRTQLTGYIESAFPLNDPVLIRSRRVLLETAAQGHLLSQEPYVEATPRYKLSDHPYSALGLPPVAAGFLDTLSKTRPEYADPEDPKERDRMLLFPRMYLHQEEAFTSFLRDGRDVIVATGTGSGKTECFLVPMLAGLYQEAAERPASFAVRGIRALILYPMNALVNDQLSRLRLLVGDNGVVKAFRALPAKRHPVFGMYTGRTPYPGKKDYEGDIELSKVAAYYEDMDPCLRLQLRRLGRYPAKDIAAFNARHLETKRTVKTKDGKTKEQTEHHFDKRFHTQPGDRELMTRHEMVHGAGAPGHAPDVLVTNYCMLEYMLMRPFERPLFQETQYWLQQPGNTFLLVLDEAHMYRGARGAEVAFLIRRLRARLGILEQPEKLRVICTSASLGSKDQKEDVRRFAADLTGKEPDDFVAILGERDIPTAAPVNDQDLATLLAAMDMDALHGASSPEALRAAVLPLMNHLGRPDPGKETEEILAALHAALADHPIVYLLLNKAAERARQLEDLADELFPGHADRLKAAEVLLTLTTIARKKADDPGLVPVRLHALFRGLHAIYACTNPNCPGRQDRPSDKASVGALFAEPVLTCPHCNSRVLELASCRNCGSPYLLSWWDPKATGGDFLWNSPSGSLRPLPLLAVPPRYPPNTQQVYLYLQSGHIATSRAPGVPHRELWVPVEPNGEKREEFERCPMCQAPSSHARARITPMRTQGEQAFTVLLETQFVEQPPQKPPVITLKVVAEDGVEHSEEISLPNQGRKVLVFSDGRQKAARLAPALEHAHVRDAFRQTVALAIRNLENETGAAAGLHRLYPAVIHVCTTRGIDLFPNEATEFHQHLRASRGRSLPELLEDANQGLLQPTAAYANALFEEFTDRFYSIPALGMGTVEESPLREKAVLDMPAPGLSPDEKKTLLRLWIRLQLESRRFLPPGADSTKLGEGWERPEGLDLKKPTNLAPLEFQAFVDQTLGAAASPAFMAWLAGFCKSGFLRLENDLYFLQPAGLVVRLRLDEDWCLCDSCGRLFRETLKGTCPACLGSVRKIDPDYLRSRSGYFRGGLARVFQGASPEPFGLLAEEHSAQLNAVPDGEGMSVVEQHELRFQDISLTGGPPVDVLSCTTTMEVGIDIGQLSGVALRNVPPHVANYQQRSGRAGRRGRSIASVVTFAHGSSHDAQFFRAPADIISGGVRPPVVYIENQKILKRHIQAYVIQRFFHETVAGNPKLQGLFHSLGKVKDFFEGAYACSLTTLDNWVKAHRDLLVDEVARWAPTYSQGFDQPIEDVPRTISEAVGGLVEQIKHELGHDTWLNRENLGAIDRENLDRLLEQDLLAALINRAVFPRYAFPTDVVSFYVARELKKGESPHKEYFQYEPQRDLSLALGEYAPGSELTIDKWRFKGAALYSPYVNVNFSLRRTDYVTSCRQCDFVSAEDWAKALLQCPCCGFDGLQRSEVVRPPGFAPDLNAKRERDRGGAIITAGRPTRAQIEVQQQDLAWTKLLSHDRLLAVNRSENLVVLNRGIGDRGFHVCPDCGRSEPVPGPRYPTSTLFKGAKPLQHWDPMKKGIKCDGVARGPYFLGYTFPTDVLLIELRLPEPFVCPIRDTPSRSGVPGRRAALTLVEAISLAATHFLQIDEGELAGNWSPVIGGDEHRVRIFLYDTLPGGAGYTKMVQESLPLVLATTEALLSDCTCESSCYNCLRHYENNFIHGDLDRLLALDLLRNALHAQMPVLGSERTLKSLAPLAEILTIRGIQHEVMARRGSLEVPLVVHRSDGAEVWVDVHHCFIDPNGSESAVFQEAEASGEACARLDQFTLQNDLPKAIAALNLG